MKDQILNIFPQYTEKEIENFNDENLFMYAYVELLKHSNKLILHILNVKYYNNIGEPLKLDRDTAIIAGNIVRLSKLNTSFLQNICEKKLEICYIINRCIAETAINIKYMLVDGEDRVKRNYIKYSLLTEKELMNIILENHSNNDKSLHDIEERMKISIKNSFEDSDFDMNEINKSSNWKSIKSRANLVASELFYPVFYGTASHAIHGNWQDILNNNLIKFENGFKLNREWSMPRPQIMELTILFNFEIVELFVDKVLNENKNDNYDYIKDKIKILANYHAVLNNSHENFLNKIK